MGTKITLLLLLLSTATHAQNYNNSWSKKDESKFAFVSVGVDARHATFGSEQTDNKPSLDLLLTVGANYKGIEVAIEYEDHSALTPKFQRYGVTAGYSFYATDKISLYNGIGFGSIIREGNSNFF